MKKIGEFFSWLFVTLLLLWFAGLVFAGSSCTRVHRSAWPVTYGMGLVEVATQNWTSDETKLNLLLWKAKAAVATQSFFERTVYGQDSQCRK